VKERVLILKKFSCNPPILVQDGYYTDSKAKKFMLEQKQLFISALNPRWWYELTNACAPAIKKVGRTTIMYNAKTKEALVGHHHPTLGKKYVLTNAYNLRKSKTPNSTIPVFDDYGDNFGYCDEFNHLMHDRTWAFRRGGAAGASCVVSHADKSIWNFLMVNAWIMWRTINPGKKNPNPISFTNFCVQLSEEIIQNIDTLN
jgi:hypothetical protein